MRDLEVDQDEELRDALRDTLTAVGRAMEDLAFNKALTAVWSFVGLVNKYVDATAPWNLAKDEQQAGRLDQVLYNACEALRAIGLLVFPFLPGTGREMWRRLGIQRPTDRGQLEDLENWGGLPAGVRTDRGQGLFPRIEQP